VAQEVVETSCDNFTLTFCNKQATYAARLVGVACEVINSEGDALVNRSCDVICPTSNSSAVQVTDPSANNTLEAYFCDVDAFIQRLSGVSNGYNESSREMDDSKKVGAEQHLCDDGKSSEEIGSREHQGGRSNGHRGGKSHGNSKSDESNSDESEESNSNSDESDESNSNSDESDESSSNSDESNQGPRRFGGFFGTPRRGGGRRGNRGSNSDASQSNSNSDESNQGQRRFVRSNSNSDDSESNSNSDDSDSNSNSDESESNSNSDESDEANSNSDESKESNSNSDESGPYGKATRGERRQGGRQG
jgi:hypothetical protein